jgi:hypothetical protein
MSDTILARVRQTVEGAKAPDATQIVTSASEDQASQTEVKPLDENYQVTSLKKNTAGTPITGFSMSVLADELGAILSNALHKAGVNSVKAETLGIFDMLGIVPKGFRAIEDKNVGCKFFVLKGTNRGVDIYKQIIKAVNATISETVSFPYIITKTLQLPVKYNNGKQDFDYAPVTVESLTLTREEIESLNYTFITEIKFHKAREASDVDLISLCIDREEWKSTPFRTSNVL